MLKTCLTVFRTRHYVQLRVEISSNSQTTKSGFSSRADHKNSSNVAKVTFIQRYNQTGWCTAWRLPGDPENVGCVWAIFGSYIPDKFLPAAGPGVHSGWAIPQLFITWNLRITWRSQALLPFKCCSCSYREGWQVPSSIWWAFFAIWAHRLPSVFQFLLHLQACSPCQRKSSGCGLPYAWHSEKFFKPLFIQKLRNKLLVMKLSSYMEGADTTNCAVEEKHDWDFQLSEEK